MKCVAGVILSAASALLGAGLAAHGAPPKKGDKKNLEFVTLASDVKVAISQPFSATSLLVRTKGGVVVLVDTPTTPKDTRDLLEHIKIRWGEYPRYAFNSHWHFDATGGNQVLKEVGAQIIATKQTNRLLRERGIRFVSDISQYFAKKPKTKDKIDQIKPTLADIALDVKDRVAMTIGDETIEIVYPGPSHTPDSVGVYFRERGILYGGCTVRSDGKIINRREANFPGWDRAIAVFKSLRPRIVVPGHGRRFDPQMLDETSRTVAKIELALSKNRAN